jgi:hypothetical protein
VPAKTVGAGPGISEKNELGDEELLLQPGRMRHADASNPAYALLRVD